VVAAAALPVVQLFGEHPDHRQVMIARHKGYNKEKGSGGQGEEREDGRYHVGSSG